MNKFPWPFSIIGDELPGPKDYRQEDADPEAVLVGEDKLDGRRLLIAKTPDSTRGFGRHPSSISGTFESVALDLAPLTATWPDWSVTDGELFARGRPAAFVSTAIATGEDLEYLAFAAPFWNNQDLRAQPYAANRALMIHNDIDCVAIQASWDEPPTEKEIHELCRSRRPPLEGLVLKRPDLGYGQGWYRCKEVCTIDCVVLSLQKGRGKYRGMVGALRCGLFTGEGNVVIEVCSASGMTDEERAVITEKDLGRVVEIEYQQVDAGGRLRFPRFLRWRDNKPTRQCTIEQLHPGMRPRYEKCVDCTAYYPC
jgi:ATP-dependent DNA ligase